jgi:hypothetical protein
VQLIEAPGGTVIASHAVQAPLAISFSSRTTSRARRRGAGAAVGGASASPSPDAPASARAYELYLRGNEIGRG